MIDGGTRTPTVRLLGIVDSPLVPQTFRHERAHGKITSQHTSTVTVAGEHRVTSNVTHHKVVQKRNISHGRSGNYSTIKEFMGISFAHGP